MILVLIKMLKIFTKLAGKFFLINWIQEIYIFFKILQNLKMVLKDLYKKLIKSKNHQIMGKLVFLF